MSNKFTPGQSVSVTVSANVTKFGSVQRITENTVYVKHYNGAIIGYKHELVNPNTITEQKQQPYGTGLRNEIAAIQSVMEKKLTPAEMKKREEVATAMERENPGMDKSKKMAIATATAKKVAEAKSHTVPETEREKDLAAAAHPIDKITHKDVLVKRGVVKEEELDEEQLDELSKDTLKSYGRKAIPDMEASQKRAQDSLKKADAAFDKGNDAKAERHYKDVEASHNRTQKRSAGLTRMVTRLTKEEVELDEAMISYSDFQSKIDAHRKAGNEIKGDKYDKKKASYTVIDKEGTAKKITHTDSGVSQQHLGSMKRDDDESSETKSTEKRGRGRPAGSKSGARN